jgi:hypothetical protein
MKWIHPAAIITLIVKEVLQHLSRYSKIKDAVLLGAALPLKPKLWSRQAGTQV